MHFGFEKKIQGTVYFIEQWGLVVVVVVFLPP